MSISVQQITKKYDGVSVLNDISFDVQQGVIAGFLGPNGAGKTTTMKILCGFTHATEGQAFICGSEVNTENNNIRSRIGYLPENNPLYEDMYVREYLHFVADIHKLRNVKQRIEEVIGLTGLVSESQKKISALSKGYRQRVGLAQAILHDPEVLILDEPTSGLDPNQLAEIRTLIKELGKEKTVLLSTHIMQEVHALCDQVIIINKGRIVANDPIELLQSRMHGERRVVVEFKNPIPIELIEKLEGVSSVNQLSDHRFVIISNTETDVRTILFDKAVSTGNKILEIKQELISMEDVFLELTQ